MKCPVCRAVYRTTTLQDDTKPCRRCGTDLSALIQIHDRAIAYHRAAIERFVAEDLEAAIALNAKAITLHSKQPSFHAFAGQLSALQGDFDQSLRSWQQVKILDPNHAIVKIIDFDAVR